MFIKLVRVGHDSELRYTADGKPVLGFNVAYNVGYGKSQKTQWLSLSMWGDKGTKLVEYIKKGTQLVVYCDDLQVEQYEKNGEFKALLKARCSNVEFAGKKEQGTQSNQSNQSSASNQSEQTSNEYDAFEDDIPF